MSCGTGVSNAGAVAGIAPPPGVMLFFPGTKGPAGPAGPTGPQGERGAQGYLGPIGTYVGSYAPNTIYFDNEYRVDIVDYGGTFWRASNTAKNGLTTWSAPNVADWESFGASLNLTATQLKLLAAQNIAVGLNMIDPGYLKSNDFVQFVSGWLAAGNGRFEAYDALIAGLISTNSPRFNLQSVTRTMPATVQSQLDIPALVDGDIPVNPDVYYATGDDLIIYGWGSGPNTYLPNRFGNSTQVFEVSLEGIGSNTSGGADLFYIQLFYRKRTDGGAWDSWTQFGQGAYMIPYAASDQSFFTSTPLEINMLVNQDIQFAAGFSKGGAGTVSVGGGKISVLAFN